MNGRNGPPRAMLSIDVDDLLIANLDFADETVPPTYATQVPSEFETTLRVLGACEARATIFVNVQYAAGLGGLLAEAVAQGHVLGSHGHGHRDVQRLTLDEFRDDLRRSLDGLRRYQEPIVGYRAPGFSMPYDEAHFDILREEGIRYLSTGVGVARSNAPTVREPLAVAPGLLHVPISMRRSLGLIDLAVGYGSAARLLPEALAVRLIQQEIDRLPGFHFYFHPFEIAGANRSDVRHIRDRRRRLATWIFALRCGGRERLFRRIFGCAAFEPIETFLAGRLGDETAA